MLYVTNSDEYPDENEGGNSSMNRHTRLLVAAIAAAVFSTAVLAQQQPYGPAAGFREKYKYTFQLMQMVRHIGEMEKDKKYALTPAQAKKVLAVLKPLRSKPKLTQDQAKQALKDLKSALTAEQLNAMARMRTRFRPGPPGGAGPRAGGQQPQRRWDPNAMKDFNPFYSKAKVDDPRAKERQKRWNEFFSKLEQKAKSGAAGAPAKPAPRTQGRK